YDPATNSWSAAGSLATARYIHTATLLPSGKVLAAGGDSSSGNLASAELYDPATNSWSAAGSLANARYYHTATLLASGKVLVAGGYNSGALASAELYDPASDSWSAAGLLSAARYAHTATLLPSGKVLVAGGLGISVNALASAEQDDPGLTPVNTRIPDLISANSPLLQGGQLTATASGSTYVSGVATATGFMPWLEASGGATNNSASNSPVFEIQRLDNEQTRFVPNDETLNTTDTSFTGSANALACFPPGPARIRAWVNGVPSAAQYLVVTSDTIFTNGFEAMSCPY
ncbi:MAG: hypothetical protein KGH80_11190, partial [Xanthomonadaceae bacterium]|nr:hypothetical protein [Xanthomonadaceae bacterium]